MGGFSVLRPPLQRTPWLIHGYGTPTDRSTEIEYLETSTQIPISQNFGYLNLKVENTKQTIDKRIQLEESHVSICSCAYYKKNALLYMQLYRYNYKSLKLTRFDQKRIRASLCVKKSNAKMVLISKVENWYLGRPHTSFQILYLLTWEHVSLPLLLLLLGGFDICVHIPNMQAAE